MTRVAIALALVLPLQSARPSEPLVLSCTSFPADTSAASLAARFGAANVVEKVNRRPFRLAGFSWDYGGTTMSWSSGRIARDEAPGCRVFARFWLEDEQNLTLEQRRLAGQVDGSREFSSAHPAVSVRRPWVRELGLFRDR